MIPKNRTFADEILKTLGLSHNDTKGIMDVCRGLSLNDSYWIVPEGTRTNPYRLSFEEVRAAVMGAKQKEQLRRMIGFTFKRHPSLNFTEDHLRALEKLLEIRVRRLLAIPTKGKAERRGSRG